MRPRVPRKYIPLASTLFVFLILYATGCLCYGSFSQPQVFINFFSENSFLGIIAVGMTFVILSGGIDLSVGSVMALCSILLAVLMAPPPPIQVRDFTDAAALAATLRDARDPLSVRLRKKLKVRRRGHPTLDVGALLDEYDGDTAPSPRLQRALARALSQLVRGECIYSRRGFRHVKLSKSTRELLASDPAGKQLVRLNRLLLVEAYPNAIARRPVTEPRVQPGWAIALVLVLGTLFGLLMGSLIRCFGLAPFIVTLAGMFLARGLALIIHIESLPIANPFYRAATDWAVELGTARVPLTAFIFLAIVAIGMFVSACTVFGRNVYAIGGNEEAALLMGVAVGRTKVLVYALSGFCSALAGVVYTFYGSSGNPSAGVGMELDAIAAVVVGGTLLSGGVGYVFGTLIGVLIFGVIRTGIDFHGKLSTWWTKVAIGVLLLFFILLQKVFARRAAPRA